MTKTIKINFCTQCPHHRLESDPDPEDWFNDDDEKLLCAAMAGKIIDRALRPYETEKVKPPKWCPLKDA